MSVRPDSSRDGALSHAMAALRRWIARLAGRSAPKLSEVEAAEMGTVFRARYHSLKLLLAANGRALE